MSDGTKQSTLAWGLLLFPPLLLALMLLAWPYVSDDKMLMSPILSVWSGGKGFGTGLNGSEDFRIFLVVVFAGALGASIHAMQSFASFVGNQTFSGSWFWWYVLRLPMGSLLSVALYLALRGGILATADAQGTAPLDSVNVFGVAAVSILAGLFSRQAIDKLKEVFDVLFPSKENDQRADPLVGLTGFSITPDEVKVGATPLPAITIRGPDITAKHKVYVNDQARAAVLTGDALTLTLLVGDVSKAGEHKIVVEDDTGSKTQAMTLKVVA